MNCELSRPLPRRVSDVGYLLRDLRQTNRSQPKGAEVWVLNPKALPAFLEHEHTIMSPEDVHLVCYHLSRSVRGTELE